MRQTSVYLRLATRSSSPFVKPWLLFGFMIRMRTGEAMTRDITSGLDIRGED